MDTLYVVASINHSPSLKNLIFITNATNLFRNPEINYHLSGNNFDFYKCVGVDLRSSNFTLNIFMWVYSYY